MPRCRTSSASLWTRSSSASEAAQLTEPLDVPDAVEALVDPGVVFACAAIETVGVAVPREDDVVPGPAVDRVAAAVALELVVAGPAGERVVAVAAVEDVAARPAAEDVVAALAVEYVVAAQPAEHVMAGRAYEDVGAGRSGDGARREAVRRRVAAAHRDERRHREQRGEGLDAVLSVRRHGAAPPISDRRGPLRLVGSIKESAGGRRPIIPRSGDPSRARTGGS